MARKSKAAGATPKPTKKGATPGRVKKSAAIDLSKKQRYNERLTPEQVIEALAASAGIKRAAARMLKVARNTIDNYISRYPAVAQALEEIEEDRLDIAETVLVNRMTDDKSPVLQLKAVEFYLRTKGKRRGFTMATEVMGKDGAPIETKANVTIDISKCTPEELAELERSALASVTAAPTR